MITVAKVGLSTTATLLFHADGQSDIRVTNPVAFTLGPDNSVTVSTGVEVAGNNDRVFHLKAGDELWGILASSTSTASVYAES